MAVGFDASVFRSSACSRGRLVTWFLVLALSSILMCGAACSIITLRGITGYHQMVFGPMWIWGADSVDMSDAPPLVRYEAPADYYTVTVAVPRVAKDRYWVVALLMRRQ